MHQFFSNWCLKSSFSDYLKSVEIVFSVNIFHLKTELAEIQQHKADSVIEHKKCAMLSQNVEEEQIKTGNITSGAVARLAASKGLQLTAVQRTRVANRPTLRIRWIATHVLVCALANAIV